MTKRAVTYARVSGDDRDTDGRNLKSQLEMCREHCARRGHAILEEMAEDIKGASGADFDLPQLTRLQEMAHDGEFDVLVVREVDRLSRDQIKAAILRQELRKCGVEIEYTLYDFPPGPSGDMARQMMEVIAQYQRQDAIIKTARGRRNSVKSGNVNVAGRPPYGYHVVEDKQGEKLLCRRLAIHEPEAQVVRMIFDWYTRGDGDSGTPLTMNAITRRLRELGVPTASESNPVKRTNKQLGACEWNRIIVLRMLKNETYAGRWYYGKRRSVKEDEVDPCLAERLKARKQGSRRHKPGQKFAVANPREHWLARPVPAVVDAETWQAAQEQLEANRRNAWRATNEEYLLRRLLTCGKCGASVQCESSQARDRVTKYRYYVCAANRHRLNYAHQCRQPSFRADWVDAEVWKWIKGLLSEPDKLQKALAEIEQEGDRQAAPKRRRLDALEELIGENTAELERVKAMCQRGIYSLDEAAGKTTQIEEMLGRLNKERVKLETAIAQQVRSSEQVRGVLEFAKAQGPNVSKATRRFEVRRGLMEDLEVTASLAFAADGVPEVNAACVLGKKTFRQDVPITRSR